MQRRRLPDGKLPIFVFPNELTFYADDKDSHKQVLTIYNPYEFALRFKLKCTAPDKYSVQEAEGTIQPSCCVDVVIRHLSVGPASFMARDKFRVELYECKRPRQLVGRREVPALLLPLSQSATAESEFSQQGGRAGQKFSNVSNRRLPSPAGGGGNLLLVTLVALCCVVALLLPLAGEPSSLPDYLHLSLHLKLAAAYFLGLTTMVILRQ